MIFLRNASIFQRLVASSERIFFFFLKVFFLILRNFFFFFNPEFKTFLLEHVDIGINVGVDCKCQKALNL